MLLRGHSTSTAEIGQCLMKMLNVSGGNTHGRGITDSTLAKFTGALPKCIPICAALEEFASTTGRGAIYRHQDEEG